MSPAEDSRQRTNIRSETLSFLGHPVVIETGEDGMMIPIMDRLADPEHYVGPSEFEVVVNFGSLFVDRGMRGVGVSPDEMWSKANPPPEGIRVLRFSDPKVESDVDSIADISATEFYDDFDSCFEYLKLNRSIFSKIQSESGVDPKTTKFIGLVRAGAVAGEILGIPLENQVLIQTKRLRLKGNDGGDISIGISYLNLEDFEKLNGEHLLVADSAGATYASVMANILYLRHKGVRPMRVSIWNTVASHQGSLLAIRALGHLGIYAGIIAGGYSPRMNGEYYLETPQGTPSVGDAGNALNAFLDLESVIGPKA